MKLFLLLPLWASYAAAFVPRTRLGDPETYDLDLAGPVGDRDIPTARDTRDSFEPDWASSDLVPAVVDAKDVSTAGITKAALLFNLKNRLIFFVSARISAIVVKVVLEQLEKHKIIGKPEKATVDFITGALEKITIIVLTLALLASTPKEGVQIVEVGADAGAKVKRSLALLDQPVNMDRWDISDDDAHAAGNRLYGRAVVSDDLRSQMLDEGLSNITAIHDPDSHDGSPVLAYHGSDDRVHFHWRQQNKPAPEATKDLFTHHYPFFDANGAGFKISAHTPIGPHTQAMTEDDAKKIAQVMVKDFLTMRVMSSTAGYEEKYKDTGALGHRLCYIAEAKQFNLKDEFDLCFPAAK